MRCVCVREVLALTAAGAPHNVWMTGPHKALALSAGVRVEVCVCVSKPQTVGHSPPQRERTPGVRDELSLTLQPGQHLSLSHWPSASWDEDNPHLHISIRRRSLSNRIRSGSDTEEINITENRSNLKLVWMSSSLTNNTIYSIYSIYYSIYQIER